MTHCLGFSPQYIRCFPWQHNQLEKKIHSYYKVLYWMLFVITQNNEYALTKRQCTDNTFVGNSTSNAP